MVLKSISLWMNMDMPSFMDWIGIDISTFEYIRAFSVFNYKANGTEDAFKFHCLPVNRNIFPPLGNLTPQDAEPELILQLSRVPLPTACRGYFYILTASDFATQPLSTGTQPQRIFDYCVPKEKRAFMQE